MHKPESIRENQTLKILRDFDIQTGHVIPARRTDLVLIKKEENLLYNTFYNPADHIVKIKEK